MRGVSEAEPGWAPYPGASRPVSDSDALDWINDTTGTYGLSITTAVPPSFARFATLLVPDDLDAKRRADAALVGVLRGRTAEQPWWLGYLETGMADLVAPAQLRVLGNLQWPYVLLEGGPEQALTWRHGREFTPWHSELPELVFPADHSWLVATRWDDDWRCLGGPADLIAEVLAHPDLDAREVGPDEDMTPPGHEDV